MLPRWELRRGWVLLASTMHIPDQSCDNFSVVEMAVVIPPVEVTDWSPLATIAHIDQSPLEVGDCAGMPEGDEGT